MNTSCTSHKAEFFAEVLRPPAVRTSDGGKLRLSILDSRRYFSEFAVIAFIGIGWSWWFSRFAGPWAYLILAVLAVGYTAGALVMKRMDERMRVEIDSGRLFLGAEGEEVECAGTIEEILCVHLSGHEDKGYSESGSSRVYVVIDNGNDPFAVPLLVSSTDLRPTAERLASMVACRYRDGHGLAVVPKEVRSWSRVTPSPK